MRHVILLLSVMANLYWRAEPTFMTFLLTAGLYLCWAVWVYVEETGTALRILHTIAFLGACCTGLVVFANGGFMPVIGLSPFEARDVHVAATEAHSLLILADRMEWPLGCSPGDVILASAVSLMLIYGLACGLISVRVKCLVKEAPHGT